MIMRNREKLWGRECKESEPRPALCACIKLESITCRRTKYAAATSVLQTAHDFHPISLVTQSDRMLVELIQRSGLQSKPGSKIFSSIPGLSYFPFYNLQFRSIDGIPAHFLALNKHNLECYAAYTLDTVYIKPNVIFKVLRLSKLPRFVPSFTQV